MGEAASAAVVAQSRDFGVPRILKLKLGGDALDLSRVQAVRETAAATRLLIDAMNHGRHRITAKLFRR